MTIVKLITLITLLLLSGCNNNTKSPTIDEFEKNPKLLNEWIQKCYHGEWNNLGDEEKSKKGCDSAMLASNAMSQKAAGEAASATFNEMINSR